MAPKQVQISELGAPAQSRNGWRAQAKIDRIVVFGPQRATKKEAWADVALARQSTSREAYARCLQEMRAAVKKEQPVKEEPVDDSPDDPAPQASAASSSAQEVETTSAEAKRRKTQHKQKPADPPQHADMPGETVETTSAIPDVATPQIWTCPLKVIEGVNWCTEMSRGRKFIEFRKLSSNRNTARDVRMGDKLLLSHDTIVHGIGTLDSPPCECVDGDPDALQRLLESHHVHESLHGPLKAFLDKNLQHKYVAFFMHEVADLHEGDRFRWKQALHEGKPDGKGYSNMCLELVSGNVALDLEYLSTLEQRSRKHLNGPRASATSSSAQEVEMTTDANVPAELVETRSAATGAEAKRRKAQFEQEPADPLQDVEMPGEVATLQIWTCPLIVAGGIIGVP